VAATYGHLSAPQVGPEHGPAEGVLATLLPFGTLLLLVRRRKALLNHKGFRALALLVMAGGLSLVFSGCGGSSNFNSSPSLPPAGAQTVTITATANGVATTTTLTVNVTN
jgi:hypothetical protein